MELGSLGTRCPVCGAKNAPVGFTAEIEGGNQKVKADYYCEGKVRRILRWAKPCLTQYRIILRGDAAERVIHEIYLADGTGYGAREEGGASRGI